MSSVQVMLIEGAVMPTEKTDIGTTPSWSWADIEFLLSAEWEIGGSATPAHVSRGLVAGEQKTSEGI